MALFPHLELENRLQIKDKTRLGGVKSYVSVGSSAITTATIKPGDDGSAISVFNTDQDLWYLDWQFNTWNGDFDSTNNKLDFNEGGSELTATITAGTYTLSTLATEIKTQMEVVGAETYTVSFDKDDKLTISSTGRFSLLPNEGSNSGISAWPLVGISSKPGAQDTEFANKTTLTGEMVRFLQKKVTLTIGDGVGTESQDKYINLYSVSGDDLFSNDDDLHAYESDILKWIEAGRNTFKKFHRYAQDEIIDYLLSSGYIDIDGNPFEIKNLIFKDDLRKWSSLAALRLIFDDLSNANDDIFFNKARGFESREMKRRNMAILRADIDNDGIADIGEGIKIRSARLIRE